MGMVKVELSGSFPDHVSFSFGAQEGGHALSLSRAISALAKQLPAAIELDHQLAADGDIPPVSPFGTIRADEELSR